MKIRIKFRKIITSISIVTLFLSFGMYDSENIILPVLMTLISSLLIIVFAE
jgi:hypothetical protein